MNIKVDIEKEALPTSVWFDNLNPGDFFVGPITFAVYVKIEDIVGYNCYNFRCGVNQYFDEKSDVIPINMEIEVTL